MPVPNPETLRGLQQASTLLQSGNVAQARTLLETLIRSNPHVGETHRLLAGALHAEGDLGGAERVLRQALTVDPNWAPTEVSLGEAVAERGLIEEAERHFRKALAINRTYQRAAVSLAALLIDTHRAGAALDLTTPLVNTRSTSPELLSEHARALMMLRRRSEAVAIYRKVVATAAASGLAELNLAAALSDSGLHQEAEASVRRALAKGFDTSKTALVLAHALLGQDRFDEAEAVLVEALERWPTYIDAHRELANLRWMRSGDVRKATASIDAVLRAHPALSDLRIIKARLCDYAGESAAAYAIVTAGLRQDPDNAFLEQAACEAAIKFDSTRARAHARRAVALAPDHKAIIGTLADALVSAGETVEAAALANDFLLRAPDDQHMLAVQATAWRVLDDPRYRSLYDYRRLVHGWTIETPPGWPDLGSYLGDLAESLRRLHTLKTHPVGQSLRHGTQTARDLTLSDDPAISAFRQAIEGPVRRHIHAIGEPDDTAWRIAGMWSVQLSPNGYHANHMHPEGWLSSACYIELPAAVDGDDRQGWIKFGEPALRTVPPLPPEHFVKPEPGLLVLFPSYMWHGTVPFSGDQRRLTIAFDVVRDG
ncbi:MAG: tetratricopeptide repeat protein [Rhodanobacteraceae bacterium]